MTPVKQEHRTSCGIAAVATLLGESYKDIMTLAKRTIWNGRKRGRFYTTTEHIKTLLEKSGVPTGPKTKTDCWAEIPSLSIVAINPRSNGRKWHWVVFRKTPNGPLVLDPNGGYPRNDFGQMKPFFYIPLGN